jgi:hypothetical protein
MMGKKKQSGPQYKIEDILQLAPIKQGAWWGCVGPVPLRVPPGIVVSEVERNLAFIDGLNGRISNE